MTENTQEKLTTSFKIRLYLIKLFDALCKRLKWNTLDRVLQQTARNNKQLYFVQIGANDGVIYDPIYQHVIKNRWSGVLVEPVPCYFEKLKQNYADQPQLIFENCAISDKKEQRDFYRVREDLDFLPEWCNGLGTFNRDVLLTHTWAIPNLEEYVITEQVQCMPLSELLNKHAITQIDLLLIDTEGFDYNILQQIDFQQIKPSIILYEHEYFDQRQTSQTQQQLRENGYKIATHLGNTLAYRAI